LDQEKFQNKLAKLLTKDEARRIAANIAKPIGRSCRRICFVLGETSRTLESGSQAKDLNANTQNRTKSGSFCGYIAKSVSLRALRSSVNPAGSGLGAG
jgi:hypothetical protein